MGVGGQRRARGGGGGVNISSLTSQSISSLLRPYVSFTDIHSYWNHYPPQISTTLCTNCFYFMFVYNTSQTKHTYAQVQIKHQLRAAVAVQASFFTLRGARSYSKEILRNEDEVLEATRSWGWPLTFLQVTHCCCC